MSFLDKLSAFVYNSITSVSNFLSRKTHQFIEEQQEEQEYLESLKKDVRIARREARREETLIEAVKDERRKVKESYNPTKTTQEKPMMGAGLNDALNDVFSSPKMNGESLILKTLQPSSKKRLNPCKEVFGG